MQIAHVVQLWELPAWHIHQKIVLMSWVCCLLNMQNSVSVPQALTQPIDSAHKLSL